jgi:acyl-coenzyme A thioesterase PaaI-like protein
MAGGGHGVAAAGIPEGFVPRPAGGPFLGPIGPVFRRPEEGGARFGIRIERRHCNSQDVAHGGMLATIADIVLGIGGAEQAGTPGHFVTISLVTDYLAPAPLGAWLECHPALLRRTSRMMFVEGRFLADGHPVLRASGVFALPRPKPDAAPAG